MLIETVYTRQQWMLPGGYAVGDGDCDDEVYVAAARRIDRKTLRKTTGLSVRYHQALQRYCEVSGFFFPP